MNLTEFSLLGLSYTDFIIVIVISFFSGLFIFFIFDWMRKKNKILIRIKLPTGEKKVRRKPSIEDKIEVFKDNGKNTPWTLTYDNSCLVPLKTRFGLSFALDTFLYAPKAISYDYENQETNQPKWDKTTETKYVRAEILSRLGEEFEMPSIWVFYVILILNIATLALLFMSMRGIRID